MRKLLGQLQRDLIRGAGKSKPSLSPSSRECEARIFTLSPELPRQLVSSYSPGNGVGALDLSRNCPAISHAAALFRGASAPNHGYGTNLSLGHFRILPRSCAAAAEWHDGEWRRTLHHVSHMASQPAQQRLATPVGPSNWVQRLAPDSGFGFQPRRGMFVQTQPTPNPASLMFLPGSPVLPGSTAEFTSARAALTSPLAISLFRIDGVSRVFLGSDFITVTKSDEVSWDVLKPEIFAAVMDFYSSGKPVLEESSSATASAEEDDEVVAMIKELLETRIRPAVQEDGGDIDFHSFNEETGVVVLRMKGACSGCPSSSVTLKSGVENMLMHYIPEITSVEQLTEDEEAEDEGTSSS